MSRSRRSKCGEMFTRVRSRRRACRYSLYSSSHWSIDLTFLKMKTGGPERRRNHRPCQPVEGSGEGNTDMTSGFSKKLASSDPSARAFRGNAGEAQSRVGWAGGQQRGGASGSSRLRCAARRRKASASALPQSRATADGSHRGQTLGLQEGVS